MFLSVELCTALATYLKGASLLITRTARQRLPNALAEDGSRWCYGTEGTAEMKPWTEDNFLERPIPQLRRESCVRIEACPDSEVPVRNFAYNWIIGWSVTVWNWGVYGAS